MQVKILKEISIITAGYTFRKALNHEKTGQSKVVLAKHIKEDGTVNYPEFIRITQSAFNTNAFVHKNDVLLSSRGVFRAGVIREEVKNTIAASSIFIIRITVDNVIPEYLAIYLNSEAGQSSIQKILTGSTIQTILRRALENLKIPIPALSTQKEIVEISENWKKREKLLEQKVNLNKNITEGTIKYLLTT